ncbi:glycoside hydrolase family 3 protein, partial [Candidatus Hodarchaeum mangrovi]
MKILYSKEEIKHLPYRKSNLPLDDRIKDILKRLTLDEKIRLLSGHRIFNTAPIPRLGLPRFRMTDGPLGVSMLSSGLTKNTRFPCTKALASTWNRELTRKFGESVAKEVAAVGRHCLLAPGINIDRTPFNGRTFEYFSEDPFLIKELVIPLVKAVQANRIATCVKHYAANNQETFRKEIDAQIDERTLHEIYLRGFESIVRNADPWSIMTCYNKVNGIYGSEHHYLLRDVLINKWGFSGFIVSDWGATKHDELTTEKCLEAGLSLEMPNAYKYKKDLVKDALLKGTISEGQINDVLRPLLIVMGKTGLFDESKTESKGERNTLDHQILAREIAEEGIVLLKNDNILPLKLEKLSSIAVLG